MFDDDDTFGAGNALEKAAPQAVEVTERGALAEITRGEVDMQVATAKRFPRNIQRFVDETIAMTTLNGAIAQSCYYTLPRGGKKIQGPSVRLAEICAGTFGNLRCGSRIIEIGDRYVTAQGVCWDMQTNLFQTEESIRPIVSKSGARYSDDMIAMTARALSSIVYRNALFRVVPRPIVEQFWRGCMQHVADLATKDKRGKAAAPAQLKARVAKSVEWFQTQGLEEAEVVRLAGAESVDKVTAAQFAELVGVATALKDGQTTAEKIRAEFAKADRAGSFGFEAGAKPTEPAHDADTGEVFGTEGGNDG